VKLQNSIHIEQIHLGCEASSASEALEVVAKQVVDALPVEEHVVVEALQARERLGSTSVGAGFAIPHCKLPGLGEIFLALIRFDKGFDFQSADGMPVSFFFVVLSPPDQPATHLQVLSQIARVLKRPGLRERLLSAPDGESALSAVREVADQEGL
jgi:PTS system nitrogen regulatory IIA component